MKKHQLGVTMVDGEVAEEARTGWLTSLFLVALMAITLVAVAAARPANAAENATITSTSTEDDDDDGGDDDDSGAGSGSGSDDSDEVAARGDGDNTTGDDGTSGGSNTIDSNGSNGTVSNGTSGNSASVDSNGSNGTVSNGTSGNSAGGTGTGAGADGDSVEDDEDQVRGLRLNRAVAGPQVLGERFAPAPEVAAAEANGSEVDAAAAVLPFTGFQLGGALAAAAGLIGSGFAIVRRRRG